MADNINCKGQNLDTLLAVLRACASDTILFTVARAALLPNKAMFAKARAIQQLALPATSTPTHSGGAAADAQGGATKPRRGSSILRSRLGGGTGTDEGTLEVVIQRADAGQQWGVQFVQEEESSDVILEKFNSQGHPSLRQLQREDVILYVNKRSYNKEQMQQLLRSSKDTRLELTILRFPDSALFSPNWIAATAGVTGRPYYYHKETRQTSWERPLQGEFSDIGSDFDDEIGDDAEAQRIALQQMRAEEEQYRAEEEARTRAAAEAEAEARDIAEEVARERAEAKAEAKHRAEEEARERAEAEAEAKYRAEEEAKERAEAEAEARERAKEVARKRAEEDARNHTSRSKNARRDEAQAAQDPFLEQMRVLIEEQPGLNEQQRIAVAMKLTGLTYKQRSSLVDKLSIKASSSSNRQSTPRARQPPQPSAHKPSAARAFPMSPFTSLAAHAYLSTTNQKALESVTNLCTLWAPCLFLCCIHRHG